MKATAWFDAAKVILALLIGFFAVAATLFGMRSASGRDAKTQVGAEADLGRC